MESKLSFGRGFNKVNISYHNRKLSITIAVIDPSGKIISEKSLHPKILIEPININKLPLNSKEINKLKNILEEIITYKIPRPKQIESLSRLPYVADSIECQALIKFCRKSECLCPLFFSQIGCIELSSTDIVPMMKTAYYFKTTPSLWGRRVYKKIFSTLRQHPSFSWAEAKKFIDKLREREEKEEEISLLRYGEE